MALLSKYFVFAENFYTNKISLVLALMPIIGIGQSLRMRIFRGRNDQEAKELESSGKVREQLLFGVLDFGKKDCILLIFVISLIVSWMRNHYIAKISEFASSREICGFVIVSLYYNIIF